MYESVRKNVKRFGLTGQINNIKATTNFTGVHVLDRLH